jgi:PadR family transcriptional regulator, regulatory protein AphA
MKRDAPTRYALLGLLSQESMSGYDIRQRISQSTSFFWTESYGQIYPQLKTLTDEGLVEKTRDRKREGRPERQTYRITSAGRDMLRAWLDEEVEPRRARNEFLLKLFFAAEGSADQALNQVNQHEKLQRKSLAKLTSLEKMISSLDQPEVKRTYWLLTVSYGRFASEAAIKWCEEARQHIQKIAASQK